MKINDVTVEGELLGVAPNGSLFLGEQKYSWGGDLLFNELLKGKDVKCIAYIDTSEYNFTIKSLNMPQLCSKMNYEPGAGELTLKEAVQIYLEDTREYIKAAGDCIENNAYKAQTMDTNAIEETFNGYFLEIWLGNYHPAGEYRFPWWELFYYSTNYGKGKIIADYYFMDELSSKAQINIENGNILSGYNAYRTYSPKALSNEYGVFAENDFLTMFSSEAKYVCKKVADNIYFLCDEKNGQVDPFKILIYCGSEEVFDISNVIENTLQDKLHQIRN